MIKEWKKKKIKKKKKKENNDKRQEVFCILVNPTLYREKFGLQV